MEVYAEYAFAENFILDLLLLLLAVKCARAKTGAVRLPLAAACGGAEAIVFPLLSLPVWAAYLVKVLGGAILPLIAVKRGTMRTYFFSVLSFFALTFALGGLLTAAYSFFGVPYVGGAYIVEGAPVGLVMGTAGLFAVGIFYLSRTFYRYRRLKSNILAAEVSHGGKTLKLHALVDTGNGLTFRGRPVNVLSPTCALLLFHGEAAPYGRITVTTVNGSKDAPVFPCDLLKLGGCVYRDVLFTVGDVGSKEYQIVLHTSYSEEKHEALARPAKLAAEDKR